MAMGHSDQTGVPKTEARICRTQHTETDKTRLEADDTANIAERQRQKDGRYGAVWVMQCNGYLFLVVSLTISGINYNPEVEGGSTPARDFLLGLQQGNPLVVGTFETGRHTFDLDHTLCWKPR